MRIYLDACSLQRPLDDRGQPRINIEAEAVLTVLALVETGDLELLSSEVLDFEITQIPDVVRQARAREILKLAVEMLKVTDEIETQADTLVTAGIKPIDALHLATASATKADYFCCDDALLKKGKKVKTLDTKVVSPL